MGKRGKERKRKREGNGAAPAAKKPAATAAASDSDDDDDDDDDGARSLVRPCVFSLPRAAQVASRAYARFLAARAADDHHSHITSPILSARALKTHQPTAISEALLPPKAVPLALVTEGAPLF